LRCGTTTVVVVRRQRVKGAVDATDAAVFYNRAVFPLCVQFQFSTIISLSAFSSNSAESPNHSVDNRQTDMIIQSNGISGDNVVSLLEGVSQQLITVKYEMVDRNISTSYFTGL